ncbi:PAOX-like protein [Mya arenaria]|uniref:PAOX-like protein n=1 Tax=Mya arenaria TaxID=6604 RepID=A0ABY7DFK2_MYAAR|nr:spermine oxidase-like [Mya arenaria]WAQ96432.1 PAOX-like protein [Mya arenaria]
MSDVCNVVVIGAGIAGLSAASRLFEAGYKNTVILEASDRIGGRIQTVQFGDGPYPVELGANWIHGSSLSNSVFKVADTIGALSPYRILNRASSRFLREDGTEIERVTVVKAYYIYKHVEEELYNIVFETTPSGSDRTFLPLTQFRQRLKEERENLVGTTSQSDLNDIKLVHNALENYLRFHEGDELDRVAWELGASSWVVPEGGDVHIPGGYRQVLDYIIRNIPAEAIRFNSEVERVSYSRDGAKVRVQTGDGHVIKADHVIVTCSLGYLKKHHTSIFDPPLPKTKVATIESMAMGRVNKIFLVFDRPVTAPTYKNIALAWENTDIGDDKRHWYRRIFGFDQVFTKTNTIIAWIAGDGAEHMESLTDEEIGNTCVSVLRQFLGNRIIPALKSIRVSRWCSNPYTLGSYSYQTPRLTRGEQEELARPVRACEGRPVLLFAGEAMANGCTHGARDTGLKASETLISFYERKQCKAKL